MACTYAGVEYSDGAIICVSGKEMKCYSGAWTETGNACTSFSEDEVALLAPSSLQFRDKLYGDGSNPRPEVFTYSQASTIVRIVGIGSDIIGRVRVSGEGTKTLVVEVWSAALARWEGSVWATIIS
jgi:hypothetical protein